MRCKQVLIAVSVVVLMLASTLFLDESDGDRTKIDAKSAYYDGEYFILEFSEPVSGYFTYFVSDIDGNKICSENANQFDDMYGIRFAPDDDQTVINTDYIVFMTSSTNYVQEKITVKVQVETINLDVTSANLDVGDSINLHVSVSPSEADVDDLVWESDNPDVATVDKGYVKAMAGGEANISVKTLSGVKAECKIMVNGESAPELKSIIVSGEYRTEYLYGETLDTDGIIIIATYTDGSTKDVTVNSTFSPTLLTQSGEVTIKVAYGAATTQFSVNVQGGPVVPEDDDEKAGVNVSVPLILCVAVMIVGAIGLFLTMRRRP